MNNKYLIVQNFLRSLGSVAVKNLADPVNVPYGTLMNIRGVRSKAPRYDNVHKVYQYLKGKAIDEHAQIIARMKPLTMAQMRALAGQCKIPFETLIKIRYGKRKFAPSYINVHTVYMAFKSKTIVPSSH